MAEKQSQEQQQSTIKDEDKDEYWQRSGKFNIYLTAVSV